MLKFQKMRLTMLAAAFAPVTALAVGMDKKRR